MAKLTSSGVCYNLVETPYRSIWGGLQFCFSSYSHKDKFDQKVKPRIEWLNDSFERRFHIKVDVSLLAVLQLYQQVETRGSHIIDMGTGKPERFDDFIPTMVLMKG